MKGNRLAVVSATKGFAAALQAWQRALSAPVASRGSQKNDRLLEIVAALQSIVQGREVASEQRECKRKGKQRGGGAGQVRRCAYSGQKPLRADGRPLDSGAGPGRSFSGAAQPSRGCRSAVRRVWGWGTLLLGWRKEAKEAGPPAPRPLPLAWCDVGLPAPLAVGFSLGFVVGTRGSCCPAPSLVFRPCKPFGGPRPTPSGSVKRKGLKRSNNGWPARQTTEPSGKPMCVASKTVYGKVLTSSECRWRFF
jgi:hypothetical protein